VSDSRVLLHAAAVPRSAPPRAYERLRPIFAPLVGPLARIVVDVSGPRELLARSDTGFPPGAARAEALAVRLRREGVELDWGAPRDVGGVAELLALQAARGRSSVDILRADPTLVSELEIGSWFNAAWRGRLVRQLGSRLHVRSRVAQVLPRRGLALQLAADAAFWSGVRSAATRREWNRLTRSSYVILVYHRLAVDVEPGQRYDVDAGRFAAHLRALRLAGFRRLSAHDILSFHARHDATLPQRCFAVTVDDGFQDCVAPLLHAVRPLRPQLFVCTQELGGSAYWAENERIMDWDEVAGLAAEGVSIGAHGRKHRRLSGLPDSELEAEVSGSLQDLRDRLEAPVPVLAYPHGAHDERVRTAAIQSGYAAAYTTEKGRNGAGTDPYCLRRMSVHAWDGRLAILWKALTGEPVPRQRHGT
jgi:peptidoglycan/xylan/chitin deacetylase (PgdA/CDA1 family)